MHMFSCSKRAQSNDCRLFYVILQDGVFEPPFTDFLEQRQQPGSGCTPEQRDQAFKMMARLSNPLLRQPAPFEF